MTFADHVERWKDCKLCPLCNGRRQVVHARGSLPADVLVVAEAPGLSEDMLGYPLAGPAGHLWDEITAAAVALSARPAPRMFLANLVGCFPAEAKEAGTNEPADAEIEKCAPRLQELARLADKGGTLKLVVAVGNLARDWLDPKRRKHVKLHRVIKQVHVQHPAGILHSNDAVKGIMTRRATVLLGNALEDL